MGLLWDALRWIWFGYPSELRRALIAKVDDHTISVTTAVPLFLSRWYNLGAFFKVVPVERRSQLYPYMTLSTYVWLSKTWIHIFSSLHVCWWNEKNPSTFSHIRVEGICAGWWPTHIDSEDKRKTRELGGLTATMTREWEASLYTARPTPTGNRKCHGPTRRKTKKQKK